MESQGGEIPIDTPMNTGGSDPGGAVTGNPGDFAVDIDEGSSTLWYEEPADVWTEALPVGNGPGWFAIVDYTSRHAAWLAG